MDLEQLKVVWDSHNREPLFTVSPVDLHAIIKRRIQEANRCATCRYLAEICISMGVGIATLLLAGIFASGRTAWLTPISWPKAVPSPWDVAALIVAASVWFYFALYLNIARLRLRRRGETFDSTLRGDIDLAIARVEFQIKMAKDVVWRGFVPVWVAATLWVLVLFKLSIEPARRGGLAPIYVVFALAMIGAFAMEVWSRQKAIRKRYEPHRLELESLRRKIADLNY